MTGLDDATTLRTLHILAVSFGIAFALGVIALLFPRAAQTLFDRVERTLATFSERRTLAIVALFLAVIAIRLLALPFLHVPVPGIHDEYSYLLLSDTFAHGRLTNPTHPMWISFETFHVNWFPTYSSMYPPAQGAALALGQILGNPWIGVLLSDGAMCAAILWMLQAWLPARWALLGAAIVALKLGIASYWMNSYWGGAVAAIGGALVLGAAARIVKRACIRDALLLGLGIAILANSRPYEGTLFCVPVAVWLLWWLMGRTKSKDALRIRLTKIVIPLTAVVVLTAAWMGYYNWRLTGSALLMPHVLNTTHSITPRRFFCGNIRSLKCTTAISSSRIFTTAGSVKIITKPALDALSRLVGKTIFAAASPISGRAGCWQFQRCRSYCAIVKDASAMDHRGHWGGRRFYRHLVQRSLCRADHLRALSASGTNHPPLAHDAYGHAPDGLGIVASHCSVFVCRHGNPRRSPCLRSALLDLPRQSQPDSDCQQVKANAREHLIIVRYAENHNFHDESGL